MAKNKARTKKELVKRLTEVRIIEIACKSVGISRATFYRWINEDDKFSADCNEAIAIGTDTISDLAESQIVSKIKIGELRAATYWLEHHHTDYKSAPRRQPVKTKAEYLKENKGPLTNKEIDFYIKSLKLMKENSKDG